MEYMHSVALRVIQLLQLLIYKHRSVLGSLLVRDPVGAMKLIRGVSGLFCLSLNARLLQ